ncbi:MAG: hypothetical protein AB7T49_10195 [Oligoflexales bacterium]
MKRFLMVASMYVLANGVALGSELQGENGIGEIPADIICVNVNEGPSIQYVTLSVEHLDEGFADVTLPDPGKPLRA